MVHLTLAGVSDDGTRLLLVDDAGAEFTLTVDVKLRAALRGDRTRIGQLELPMDSALRPRDIQMRIRAGETPEAVAQAAQTTVEKIMPFAAPVLAEREHIAGRAQAASVRRRSDAGQSATGARTLGDIVAAHLRAQGAPADSVSWDAFRREDGRWSLTGAFSAGARTGTAQFSFDAPGNFVTVDNDDARWLLGEAADPAPAAAGRGRRLSAVPDDEELPLGEDAIELVIDPEPPAPPVAPVAPVAPARAETADLTETAARVRDLGRRSEPTEEGSFFDAVFARAEAGERIDGAAAVDPVHTDAAELEDASEEAQAEAPTRVDEPAAKPAKRKSRSSVPSWDEIMFGGSDRS